MKPNLYVFDLDGTVTIESKAIPHSLQNTIRALQRQGDYCTMATGNAFVQIVRNFKGQFIPNAPMILENGGRIVDIYESTITEFPLEQSLIDTLPHFVTNNDITFLGFYGGIAEDYLMYSPHELTSESMVRIIGQQTRSVEQLLDWIEIYRPVRFVFGIESGQLHVPEEFNGTLAPNVGTYEITAPNVDKGSSLSVLVDHIGMQWKDVAVFGNGYNDISLFQTPADTKVYVGDECPKLEELSTHQVEDALALDVFLRDRLNP